MTQKRYAASNGACSGCYFIRLLQAFVVFWLLLAGAMVSVEAETQGAQSSPSYQIKPVPGWVLKNRYQRDDRLETGQPSQYLLIDRQTRLDTYPQQSFLRYVIRPLTESGVEQDSEIKIGFNPVYEQLTIHNVIVIRNGQIRDVTRQVKIRLIQQEDQLNRDLLEGRVTAVLILEDIRKDDIIDYQYSITGRNTVFGKKVFGRMPLSFPAYIDDLRIRLITAADRPLHIKMYNSDLKPIRSRVNGKIEYTLHVRKPAPVIDEQEYPHDYNPYAWMQYTEYGSWREVSQWGMGLYDDKEPPSAEFRALVKRLDAESRNDEEYIAKALAFVQNEIRYLGLEFGENSHRPHSPNEVLKKRFGDCKDKSYLLNALLAQKNIKSYPALVSTDMRDSIRNQLASPGAFNHVVSYVRHNKRSYWLDGTRSYQGGSPLNQLGVADYGYALVIGSKDLSNMYATRPLSSRADFFEDVYVKDYHSPVKFNVTSVHYRNNAEYLRYQFANQPRDTIEKNYLEFMKRFYPDIRPLQSISFKDDPKNNRFIVKEFYEINDYWKHSKNKVAFNVYILSFIEYLKAPKVKNRLSPFYLGAPVSVNHQTRVHFPEDVGLKLDPDPVKFESDVLKYEYRDSYADNVYVHKASFKTLNDRVDKDDIDSYLELRDKIKENWSYHVKFVDPGSVPGYREILTLKRRLKALSE